MIRRRPHSLLSIRVPCALAAVLLSPCGAAAQTKQTVEPLVTSLNGLVQIYRGGAFERASDDLRTLSEAKRLEEAAAMWVKGARQGGRRAELEGALMLYSEVIMSVLIRDEVTRDRLLMPYASTLVRVLGALKDIDPRSKFLRGWYLLWESLRQAYVHRPVPPPLDFLDDALAVFADDAEIQLAAGARWELAWSLSPDNPRIDPRRRPNAFATPLTNARRHLRRSVALDGSDVEARLRLIRVWLESNNVNEADKTFVEGRWTDIDPGFAYLGRLFEGTIREQQGSHAAAAKAYDAAIALARQPQSARIARSHLAHLTGARAEAARLTVDAMSSTADEKDPWWIYTKGLVWRFDAYLHRQRQMVRP